MSKLASIESEKGILKILINDPSMIKLSKGVIEANDFYILRFKKIYQRLLELDKRKINPTKETLIKDEVETDDLIDLFDGTCEKESFDSFVNHILECSEVRHFNLLPDTIKEIRDNDNLNMEQKKDLAYKTVSNIVIKGRVSTDFSIEKGLDDTFDSIEKASNGFIGIPTGIKDLDKYVIGFEKGELIILAGRPGTCKSLIVGQIALNNALNGHGVVIVSYEMSRVELLKRFLASISGIPHTNILLGRLSNEQRKTLLYYREIMRELPLTIVDDSSTTFRDIRNVVTRSQFKVDLLVSDYIQLMTPPYTNSTRSVEIGSISTELKKMSNERDLDVVTIALSQMSRLIEQRQDGIPKLSDLRDSGSLEQDADRVIFTTKTDSEFLKLYIAKQRNLPVPYEAVEIPTNMPTLKVG